MANTTWNPSDKSANITLTGSNLIATSSTAVRGGVRAVDRQITGKFYFEYTCNTIAGSSTSVGIANGGVAVNTNYGAVGTCFVVNGSFYADSLTPVFTVGSVINGSVLCFAIDCSARLLWVRIGAAGNWNASAANNPATGVGGSPMPNLGNGIPLYPMLVLQSASDQITADFGDTAFTGTVPAGFTAGFTAGATIPTNALATQIVLEEWGSGTPAMQLTQILVEEWATVATGPPVFDAVSTDTRAMVLA